MLELFLRVWEATSFDRYISFHSLKMVFSSWRESITTGFVVYSSKGAYSQMEVSDLLVAPTGLNEGVGQNPGMEGQLQCG